MSQEEHDELIDPTKMTQREMLNHLYRDVREIKRGMAEDFAEKAKKIEKLDERVDRLENVNSESRGIRYGLSLAVVILSITAVAVSVAAAIG